MISAEHAVRFRVQHRVSYGESVGLLGNDTQLGMWNTDNAIKMKWTSRDVWITDCFFDDTEKTEFKFVRIDADGEVIEWSPGPNHTLNIENLPEKEGVYFMDDVWGRNYSRQEIPLPVVKTPSFDDDEAEEEGGDDPKTITNQGDFPFRATPPDELSPTDRSPQTDDNPRHVTPVPTYTQPTNVNDDSHQNGQGKSVDIGAPRDGNVTNYVMEENPILLALFGSGGKIPARCYTCVINDCLIVLQYVVAGPTEAMEREMGELVMDVNDICPLMTGTVGTRRDGQSTNDRPSRAWELPGTQQDPNFINKRIDNARQPFTIFEIIRDQQQSLTGSNLTTAFIKLAKLTTADTVRYALKAHNVFKEMMLTAAQNSKLFSDEEVAQIIWALAQLKAEPSVDVMDIFMCNFYTRMDKLDIKVLSMALWGLARLDYIPAEKVLIRACQSMAERLRLRDGRLSDFVCCFWALAVMGYCPVQSILNDFVSLCCRCLGSLTPMEVGHVLWALIQFGLHPGQSFLGNVDMLFCGAECMWSIEETSLLFWGMASYAHSLNQLFVFNAVEKVQSCLPNCSWSVFVRILNACSRMCYHPGELFLKQAVEFLSSVVDEIYYEAIEMILWSCATFSYHPGFDLLAQLDEKIDQQLRETEEDGLPRFSALHLANIIWCHALFGACTDRVWNRTLGALSHFPTEELSQEALYRLYQVYLLKMGGEEEGTTKLPSDTQKAAEAIWNRQLESQKERPSPFYADVLRHLASLRRPSPIVQNFYLPGEALCVAFYLPSLNRGIELIDEHEFTINTTEPIGSAVFRTRLIESCLNRNHYTASTRPSVNFIKYIEWRELHSDSEKQQFLQNALN